MEKQQEIEILENALHTFGFEAQHLKLIEEMAELTQAILKLRFSSVDKNRLFDNVYEEIADVQILIDQLSIYNKEEIAAHRERKLKRLKDRLS